MWGADDFAADTAGWGPLPAGAVSYSFRAERVREETDVISLGLVGLVAVGAGDRVSADQNAQSAGGGERAHPECGRLSPRTDEQRCTGLSRVGGTSLPVLEAPQLSGATPNLLWSRASRGSFYCKSISVDPAAGSFAPSPVDTRIRAAHEGWLYARTAISPPHSGSHTSLRLASGLAVRTSG